MTFLNITNTTPKQNIKFQSTDKKKVSLELFNFLNENEKKVLDKNKDNIISFKEAKNYINSNTAQPNILETLASILNIELETNVELTKNIKFKEKANKILNLLNTIDTDNDSKITLNEIKNGKISEEDKTTISNIFGLVDGKIINKQGQFGSCWALAAGYGIFMSNPQIFRKIIQRDDNGNANITFWGSNKEIFQTTVERKLTQSILKNRTKTINLEILNKASHHHNKYYSSDPDAIVLELAFEDFNNHIIKLNKIQAEKIENYINNSSPKAPKKPNIASINLSMSEEELRNFHNYYNNSSCLNKDNYIFPYSIKDLTAEIINKMKKYITLSTPVPPLKPNKKEMELNWQKTNNYIKNSISHLEKPELRTYYNYVGTINNGGLPGEAIKLMAGGKIDTYYNEETKEGEKKLINILKNKNLIFNKKQIYSIGFKQNDKNVNNNHAYTILLSDEKYIYLINPHDTNASPIKYKIKDAVENLKILQINTLPDDVGNKF